MPELEGRVALVTGAGQGVGRGIALALAGAGAQVAVVGRTMAKCETVAAEIRAAGGVAVPLLCDVERTEDTERTVAETVAAFGRIDILVNNAQTLIYKSVRRITEADMQSMWQSGPMGSFRLMQACFDQLRATTGCVINIGSGSSILPQGKMSGYAMAKEAIRVLTRVAAVEWGAYGVRVNAICPLAETPGWGQFVGETPGAEAQVTATIPLGRLGDPATDIGPAAVFLAGPAAAYITGTTIMADGGFNYLR